MHPLTLGIGVLTFLVGLGLIFIGGIAVIFTVTGFFTISVGMMTAIVGAIIALVGVFL